MPAPEGYRKAPASDGEMAERFNMPIITFIDTPGAYLAWARKSAVSLKPSHVVPRGVSPEGACHLYRHR